MFIHPAQAYSIVPPRDHDVLPFVDALNVPYYVATDSGRKSPEEIPRGIWIVAFPIPTDDQLDPSNISPLITALILAAEPGLEIDGKRAPAKLGQLDAVEMAVGGMRKSTGPWKGRLRIAVQDDNYLVVHYGSEPEKFDALEPTYREAVESMVAPLAIKPVGDGGRGAGRTGEEEAKKLLKQCTPRVRVLARSDVKDEDTLGADYASGTGFLIHPDGYVITNRHVVESSVHRTPVRLCYDAVELHWDKSLDIAPRRAHVIGVSHRWDLALLKIAGSGTWSAVPLAEPEMVREGHKLLVAGWPEPAKYGKESVTISVGRVLGVDADTRGRPLQLRHDAFTRPGSSGGPVFDMDLGAIVAAHYAAYAVRELVDGVWQEMPGGFKVGVPVARLLWEFPQVAAGWRDRARDLDERRALVAYYLLQERFGAAFIEATRALEQAPGDGMTNAFLYRMYALQRDTERAQASLLAARRKPESSYPVVLFASQSALETGDVIESARWNIQAFQMAPAHPASHLAHLRTQIASGGSAGQFVAMTEHALGGVPHPELEMLKGLAGITHYLATYKVIQLPPRQPPPQQTLIDSIVAFERSIELWPAGQGLSWAHLGLVHAVDGRKKKAYECREQALLASPHDVFTRLSVGHLDLLYGDYETARAQIAHANRIRSTGFGLFLTGWANLLEAKTLAASNLERARELARLGRAQIGRSFDGPERQSWWRSYAAAVSSDLLGR